MKRKRVLLFVIAMAMGTIFLTACGKNATTTQERKSQYRLDQILKPWTQH